MLSPAPFPLWFLTHSGRVNIGKNKINTYCLPSTALAVLARKVALSPSLSCSVSHSGLMAPNGQLSFCWSWQGVICPIPWSCRILIWSRCKNPSFKGLLTLAIHNLPIGRVGLETTSVNRPVGRTVVLQNCFILYTILFSHSVIAGPALSLPAVSNPVGPARPCVTKSQYQLPYPAPLPSARSCTHSAWIGQQKAWRASSHITSHDGNQPVASNNSLAT